MVVKMRLFVVFSTTVKHLNHHFFWYRSQAEKFNEIYLKPYSIDITKTFPITWPTLFFILLSVF